MFDMFGAMQAVQNHQMTMMQYTMQGMIQQHPKEWEQCQQMFGGKSRNEQIKALRKLYREKGADLDAVARQWGIQL